MTARKMTRKNLKQDSFVDWTSRSVEFIQDHYLKLLIGVIGIIVVLVGVSYYSQGQVKSAQRASYLLFQGQSLLAQGAYGPAQERLQECSQDFGGTESGKRARLELGHVMIAQGDDLGALGLLEAGAAETSPEDALYRDYLRYQATALVNLKRHGEAERLYRQLLEGNPDGVEQVELELRLADCLRLDGRMHEALAVLERLQAAVHRGEITADTHDLETRLQLYRALAH